MNNKEFLIYCCVSRKIFVSQFKLNIFNICEDVLLINYNIFIKFEMYNNRVI